MDIFEVDAIDLGSVDRLIVGHDGVGRGQGWFCNKITVQRKDWDYEVVFPCNRYQFFCVIYHLFIIFCIICVDYVFIFNFH